MKEIDWGSISGRRRTLANIAMCNKNSTSLVIPRSLQKRYLSYASNFWNKVRISEGLWILPRTHRGYPYLPQAGNIFPFQLSLNKCYISFRLAHRRAYRLPTQISMPTISLITSLWSDISYTMIPREHQSLSTLSPTFNFSTSWKIPPAVPFASIPDSAVPSGR